jgi:hypothetical protein
MKIKLDDKHYLKGDQFSCWITTESVNKETGKLRENRVSGYYGTVQEAVGSYIDRKIMSSEAESLKELMAEVEALKETVKGWEIALEVDGAK